MVCLAGLKIIFLETIFLCKIIFHIKQFSAHIFDCLVKAKMNFLDKEFDFKKMNKKAKNDFSYPLNHMKKIDTE